MKKATGKAAAGGKGGGGGAAADGDGGDDGGGGPAMTGTDTFFLVNMLKPKGGSLVEGDGAQLRLPNGPTPASDERVPRGGGAAHRQQQVPPRPVPRRKV